MDEDKPRGLVSRLFGYLSIVVIAMLVAWFFVRPLGQQIHDIFQSLVNGFSHR
jgi:uncharacterized membrane protein required for colicin V production